MIFRNSKYQVIKRLTNFTWNDIPIWWLSIKRIDREIIHDWREIQEIKNNLMGPESEAVEIYPAESRRVDASNQYHLWCFEDAGFRLPFGFEERLVNDSVAQKIGAKQRPL